MDPELAASVLPRLGSPWYAFRGMEPQYAVMILSLLSSADVGRALALSPEWSTSPDPLDKVLMRVKGTENSRSAAPMRVSWAVGVFSR